MNQRTFVYEPATTQFQREMHAVYRTLRDEYPVYVAPDGAYVLSRFEDVWGAVHDWGSFSSAGVAEAAELRPQMIYMDPPDHTSLRALVSRAFTPKRVADLEPRVRAVADQLLARITSAGHCDLVHEFASPLPSTIMSDLIGVPDEHREAFQGWIEAFFEVTSPDDIAGRATNIYALFGSLLADRRQVPADDLMSALLAAQVDGDRLSDDDLLGFCFLLLVAGNDTTTSLISNGAELLARHRDQRAELASDRSLIPAAVEEMLRIESPTQALSRTAMREVELHGTTIPAGSRVMLLWGSANLDDREFDDPDVFDIHREPTRHLGFGHGIHVCLGAALARLETRVAFEELLARMPEYRLSGEPERYVSNWARAWRFLPLEFESVR
ncbi:MAG TPA: cytochrome P450 [Acidimicrobiales bacterium]